jgi:hypothetical protein
MSKVGDVVKEEVPVTCVGGSRQSTPPGYKDTLKPPTLRDSNVDELTSKLKVLKLQEKIAKLKKKLKSRKKRFKKCLPLHPEMKKAMSPPSTRVSMSRKTKAKKRMGLSLFTTLHLSIMIACLLTIPSPPCTSASLPVSMG